MYCKRAPVILRVREENVWRREEIHAMISVVGRVALSSNRKFSSQSIAQLLVAPNVPNSCIHDHPVLADLSDSLVPNC